MSASLLPGATVRRADRRPAGTGPTALDHVHDHVLRLVGDRSTARQVTADVATRAAARSRTDPSARSLEQLLRSAHARIATVDRGEAEDELLDLLAGDVDGGRQVTEALARVSLAQGALLDLTARHGLDVGAAARVLDLDRRTATEQLDRATAAVRSAVAQRGGGLHLDVRRVLRQLPLVPAPDDSADRLATTARPGQRSPVRPWIAWITTGVITLTTFGLVASTLVHAAEPAPVDAPVATAVAVEDGPAARQLAVPGSDREPAEELLVRPADPTDDEDDGAAEAAAPDQGQAPQPAPSPSAGDASPEPEPEPSPTATSSEQPSPEPSEEPSPEPSPSEPPLDLLPSP